MHERRPEGGMRFERFSLVNQSQHRSAQCLSTTDQFPLFLIML
jgi:hypothetical protein